MAISSPQIVQPINTGSNALMQLAQILGQSGQFKQSQAQQQSQFDILRQEQQDNRLATQGIEQDKLNAAGVQGGIDFANKAYDKLTSEGNLVKTFSDESTSRYLFELAKKAGLASPNEIYENWHRANAPTPIEIGEAGGNTLANRKLTELTESNAEKIRVTEEGNRLEAERNRIAIATLEQTIKSETDKGLQKDLEIFNQQEQAQGRIDLDWAKLGLDRSKAEAAGFTLNDAQDHRKTMDSTVEIMDQINDAVFNLDGKITHRTLFDINKKKRELQPRIEAYNKLADLYGTDRIIYKQSDVKRTKNTKNFFPITIGFEGRLKPSSGNTIETGTGNVPKTYTVGNQTYTEADISSMEAVSASGDTTHNNILREILKQKAGN
jgi:hypothetical protein